MYYQAISASKFFKKDSNFFKLIISLCISSSLYYFITVSYLQTLNNLTSETNDLFCEWGDYILLIRFARVTSQNSTRNAREWLARIRKDIRSYLLVGIPIFQGLFCFLFMAI